MSVSASQLALVIGLSLRQFVKVKVGKDAMVRWRGAHLLESDRSFVSVIGDRHIGKILQHRLSALTDYR